jgi:hypothetical protein
VTIAGNFGEGGNAVTKARAIAAVALAAGTLGGTIGALATAAIQSQASPQAIAAAVQRVSDSNAEQSLRSINAKLGTVNTNLATLATLNTNLATLNTNLVALARGVGINLAGGEPSLAGVARNLYEICANTTPSGFVRGEFCSSVP